MRKAFGTTEIARMCQVAPPTVGRWIEEGKLPFFTTGGGHRRVWAEDLLEFLKAHNIPAPVELETSVTPKVLVVDDETATRRLMGRAVTGARPDVEVHEAANGFEAGHKIATLRPNLVILDVRMPWVDGIKVCRMIRSDSHLKTIRILAVSGFDIPETQRECLEAGADDFLGKPFDLAELERKVAALLPAPQPERVRT